MIFPTKNDDPIIEDQNVRLNIGKTSGKSDRKSTHWGVRNRILNDLSLDGTKDAS